MVLDFNVYITDSRNDLGFTDDVSCLVFTQCIDIILKKTTFLIGQTQEDDPVWC